MINFEVENLTKKELKELVEVAVNNVIETYLNDFNKTKPNIETEFISAAKVAKKLDITLDTLKRWEKSGKINYYRIGNTKKYKIKEIEEFIESNKNFNNHTQKKCRHENAIDITSVHDPTYKYVCLDCGKEWKGETRI